MKANPEDCLRRKEKSGKAWSDACDFKVEVWLKFIFVSGLVRCDECNCRVWRGNGLKHHRELKHEQKVWIRSFVF